jgi:hypothetical protein
MVRKPKAGRPPRHAGERLVKNRTFRVWGKLDDQLQAAAEQSRRTVSAEIEFRLELSFLMDRLDAQMRALLGMGLKEALLGQLGELGSVDDEEPIKRWFTRIARFANIEAEERRSSGGGGDGGGFADIEAEERRSSDDGGDGGGFADIEAEEQRRLERKKA